MSEPLPPDPPRPLDYRSPRDEPRRVHPAFPFVGGVLLAFVAVGCAGVAASSGPFPRSARVTAVPFIVLAACTSVLGFVLWIRRSSLTHRWLILGIVFGVALASLIEGACFAVQ